MPSPASGSNTVLVTGSSAPYSVKTGLATLFGVGTKIFHVKFQLQNPLKASPQNLPKGLLVFLYKGAELVAENSHGVELDDNGYAALKMDAKGGKGNYHFVIRHKVRKYMDLDNGKLVPSEKIEWVDTRNLVEIPMELDTAQNHFTHPVIRKLTHGSFLNYNGRGEGTTKAPLVFTLNLFWYPVQIQFFHALKHALEPIPRGLNLQVRLDGKTYAESIAAYAHVGTLEDISTVGGYQKHLNLLGFDCGEVDGLDGPKTKKGVKAFQTAFKLKVDGVCGPITQKMLKEVYYDRKIAVMKDKTYLVPVLKFNGSVLNVEIMSRQADSWLYLPPNSAPCQFKKWSQDEYKALTDLDKFSYYDLPETWLSSGSQVRIKGDMNAPKTMGAAYQALNCYPVGEKEIAISQPLVYCWDDLVLMIDHATKVTWTANTRFALFDEDAKVVDPDPDMPYLTKGADKTVNYFPVKDKKLLAVFTAGEYYFARLDRVPADKEGAGLRTAVLNGVRHERVQEPMLSYTGNYHQFYFHAGKIDAGKLVSYVLLSWQCHLKVHDQVVTPAEILKAQTGITNYKKSGMTNCKVRHEAPNFEVEDKDGTTKQSIRLIKHFVAGDPAQAYCVVSVHGGAGAARDNMGLEKASFNAANYLEQSPGGWFTAAHELGHAMGLHDDYIEPPAAWGNQGWQAPIVARFAQWVKGNPFMGDLSSLMKQNETIRHRMVYHHVHWVNSDPEIRKSTGNRRFLLKNGTHRYYLPPADERGFQPSVNKFFHYTPAFLEDGFTHATGKMDLLLVQTGQDETQKIMTPTLKFDGILVACLYLKWSFTDGADTWDTAKKISQIKAMYSAIETAGNLKFYLEATESTYFKKVLVLFRLHFHEGANSADNRRIIPWTPETRIDAHFNIDCSQDARDPSYQDETFSGNSLDVAKSVNAVSLFRYFLGLKPLKKEVASVKEIKTIDAADLGFMRDWLESKLAGPKLGKGYQVKTI